MSLGDELRKLQDLHQSGALTDAEFAAAKAALLAGGPGGGTAGGDAGAVKEHLEDIMLQNELARLDREWALERQQYMVMGRYGSQYIPSRAMSIGGGVFIVGFGILWTVFAASITGGFGAGGGPGGFGLFSLFPLFGVLFILAGIGASIYSYNKAGRYEEAYQAYQRRRARLLGREEPPETT